jgi:microcystin-dependent protein
MSEPFLAEVRMVGFNFAPRGWAFCDGQTLPINQNQSLYSLLGTTYGDDGRTSFALPDMRGRAPLHEDGQHPLGQKEGEETVALSSAQMPSHSHTPHALSDDGDTDEPSTSALLGQAGEDIYSNVSPENAVMMYQNTIGVSGGGIGHDNMQPFLAINFCIALQGLFPSRN